MAERYIGPEVSDWLGRLRTALPLAAARQGGTRLDRAGLIDEIGESFAHLMSTGPDYSRAVTEYVQDAVRWFSRGEGDLAGEALRRAHDAVPRQAARPAPQTRVEGQPPVIDLSFLDEDPVPADDADWYEPLTPEQVAVLLDEAARSAGDYVRVSRIQIRLGRGMQGGRDCPCPAQQRITDLNGLFVDRYREGAAPGLVAELCRLMSAGREPETLPGERRFTVLDGVPSRDDPELTVLMEAVRRLPRDRADTAIESLLRCALGYQRTGNPEFLTRLASNALVTIRARRDPENQKALDAVPPTRD